MSEANSIAGTVGTWVGAAICLFTLVFTACTAYKSLCSSNSYQINSLAAANRNSVLQMQTLAELRRLRDDVEVIKRSLDKI